MGTVVDNRIVCLKAALRGNLKSSHYKEKYNYAWCWRLTRLNVMTISQYIQISNNDVVQLKLTLHVSCTSKTLLKGNAFLTLNVLEEVKHMMKKCPKLTFKTKIKVMTECEAYENNEECVRE